MIFETQVWCTADDAAREMGLPDGDCWMPIAIDWDNVLSIKEAGENDFIGEGKATIYISGQHFIINYDYKTAVREWQKTKHKNYMTQKHGIS